MKLKKKIKKRGKQSHLLHDDITLMIHLKNNVRRESRYCIIFQEKKLIPYLLLYIFFVTSFLPNKIDSVFNFKNVASSNKDMIKKIEKKNYEIRNFKNLIKKIPGKEFFCV